MFRIIENIQYGIYGVCLIQDTSLFAFRTYPLSSEYINCILAYYSSFISYVYDKS